MHTCVHAYLIINIHMGLAITTPMPCERHMCDTRAPQAALYVHKLLGRI